MLHLLFGLGNLIEQNFCQSLSQIICLFEFEKKYFIKHKLKTLVVGHQAFLI